jgi:MoaA/NifB/PqqE/SkfB family radical SAM enzyme
MANLSITNVCNKKCVYCFASDTLNEYGKTYMDDETYENALIYLVRSGISQARLLGGEPTLHPNFINFVCLALDENLDIMLFSNGLMSDKVLYFLKSIPEGKLSILLNTIHPNENNINGLNRQKDVMKELGKAIIPGINLYSASQSLDYILEYVNLYDLKKEIRIGISHSVLSQNNVFLHPKEYQKIGENIALFKKEAMKFDVSLGFDCGFVPCMFSNEHFELLSEEMKKTGNCCHPIIDMLSDGSFIACYPLNDYKKVKIHEQLYAKDLIKTFEDSLSLYKNIGIYPYCTSCTLFNSRCNGGCISFKIQRYKSDRSKE